MKLITVAVISLLLATSALAQGPQVKGHKSGHKGHGMMMRHANPMPNLMKVIHKRGDELDLSPEQAQALETWRIRHMEPMHGKVAEIAELEKALNNAALQGRPKAELMTMNARVLAMREQIVSTKIDCRDNMRRVLSPEQYVKVLSLYSEMQAKR